MPLWFQLGIIWQYWSPLSCLKAPRISKGALWFVQVNTTSPGKPRSAMEEGNPSLHQRQAPSQNGCSSSVSHTAGNWRTTSGSLCFWASLGHLFPWQGTEQVPPHPSTLPSNQNTLFQNIDLSCWSQTQSNFVSARNRRFFNRNYASKQPSSRTGNTGWRTLEYLLLSTYGLPWY